MSASKHNIHSRSLDDLTDCQDLLASVAVGQGAEAVGESPVYQVLRRCASCDREFLPKRQSDPRRGRFCSRTCASRHAGRITFTRHPQHGPNNWNFKGWRSRDRRAYVDQFRAKYPEKAAAHDAVKLALASRALVRPMACETCGLVARLQAHHDDYAQPLQVRFLCGRCHRAHHARNAA